MFLFLKHLFANSCFYNYTPHRLALYTGLDRHTINKYVKWFLANEWCRMHAGNLVFNNHKQCYLKGMKESAHKQQDLDITDYNLKSIKHALYLFLLQNGNRQRAFAVSRNQAMQLNPGSATAPAHLHVSPALGDITLKHASRLFKTSIRTANNIILYLQRIEHRFTRTRNWTPLEDYKISPAYFDATHGKLGLPNIFWSKGYALMAMPMKWLWHDEAPMPGTIVVSSFRLNCRCWRGF